MVLIWTLFIFALWKQYDLVRYQYSQVESKFLAKLNEDFNSLILQSELPDPEEVFLYYSQLHERFPDVDFCISSSNPIHNNFICKAASLVPYKTKVLSSDLTINFKEAAITPPSILLKSLFSFEVALIGIVSLVFSVFIYLRLKTIFSSPLLHFGREIQKINQGQRSYTDIQNNSIEEWNHIEKSLQDLVKHVTAQEALAAQAACLDLAWQVAHDIRSPLTFLNIFAEKSISIEEDEKVAILQATSRINKIANDLLKIKKGKSSKDLEQISLFHINQRIRQLFSEKKVEYNLSEDIQFVILTNDSSTPLSIPTDSDSLTRIISNILNNSLEALPPNKGGLIKVETLVKGKYMTLSIEDTGKGIRAQDLALIGREGFSIGKDMGNGLGLYHAIKKIKNAGGVFDIASIENKGTKITISIPLIEGVEKTL
jgi:signal transduction histidine kinase